MVQRIAKKPPPVVTQWVLYLKRSMLVRQVHRLKISEDSLTVLAGHLAIIGTPNDEQAIRVYQSLVKLLFSWRRLQWRKGDSIAANLRLLPASQEGLRRISAAIEAAETVENLERANFPIKNFLEVAQQLSDPKSYVAVCKRENQKLIREMFHPNTMRYIAERFRGVFTRDLASPEFHDQVSKIKTVR